MERNGKTNQDGSVNSAGNSAVKAANRKTIRNLIVYLFYAGVVLAIGTKLGAFRGYSSRFSTAKSDVSHNPFWASSNANEQAPVPLPQGILAFDAESKESTIQASNKEAHFVFNLTNVSQKPVVIERVETSCGCTAAQLPQVPWTLKPRDNGQIQVTVNVTPVLETTRKSVTLITPLGVKTIMVEVAVLSDTNLTTRDPHP